MSDSIVMESGADIRQSSVMAWFVCISAGFFFLYEFFQLNIFDVINDSLRQDFNLDAAQISWMSSTYLWADILFLLPAGLILDRCSTRRVILNSMLICVAGTLGFALTTSFPWACFFHFLTGIGNAFCFLACVVLVSRWFAPDKQALVIGSVVTMAFLGGMLAHTPFAHLSEAYGWRNALLLDVMAGVFLMVWIFFAVKNHPFIEKQSHAVQTTSVLPVLIKAFYNRQTWLGGLYTTFLNLPVMVLCALWGASYLKVVHGLSPLAASNAVSLLFIGSIVGCPLAGWLSDMIGLRKPVMLAGGAATLVSVAPLFCHLTLSEMQLSILFFSLGFFSSSQVVSYPLIAESNSRECTGSATGIASILIMGGGGLAQLLFGLIMQHHAGQAGQIYAAADFQYALWMFPLTAMLAILAAVFIRETACKQQ